MILWRTHSALAGYDVSALRRSVRRIVGVLSSCSADEEAVAHELGVSVAYVRSVVKEVRKSKNPILLRIKMRGLPVEAATDLPATCNLRCRRCGAKLEAVPCLQCCIKETPKAQPVLFDYTEEAPLPMHPYPTNQWPGTEGKIQEMRFRAALGHAVFHVDDPGERPCDD